MYNSLFWSISPQDAVTQGGFLVDIVDDDILRAQPAKETGWILLKLTASNIHNPQPGNRVNTAAVPDSHADYLRLPRAGIKSSHTPP